MGALQQALALSEHMCELAERGEWAHLAAAEEDRAAAIERFQREESAGVPADQLRQGLEDLKDLNDRLVERVRVARDASADRLGSMNAQQRAHKAYTAHG